MFWMKPLKSGRGTLRRVKYKSKIEQLNRQLNQQTNRDDKNGTQIRNIILQDKN